MFFALFCIGIAAVFFLSSLILLNYGRRLGLRYLQHEGADGDGIGPMVVRQHAEAGAAEDGENQAPNKPLVPRHAKTRSTSARHRHRSTPRKAAG